MRGRRAGGPPAASTAGRLWSTSVTARQSSAATHRSLTAWHQVAPGCAAAPTAARRAGRASSGEPIRRADRPSPALTPCPRPRSTRPQMPTPHHQPHRDGDEHEHRRGLFSAVARTLPGDDAGRSIPLALRHTAAARPRPSRPERCCLLGEPMLDCLGTARMPGRRSRESPSPAGERTPKGQGGRRHPAETLRQTDRDSTGPWNSASSMWRRGQGGGSHHPVLFSSQEAT